MQPEPRRWLPVLQRRNSEPTALWWVIVGWLLLALSSTPVVAQGSNGQWGLDAQWDMSHAIAGDAPYAFDVGAGLGTDWRYRHGRQALQGDYDVRWQEGYDAGWQGSLTALGSSAYAVDTESRRWDAQVAHRAQVVSTYEDQWWEDRAPNVVHSLTLGGGVNQRLSSQMGLRISSQGGASVSELDEFSGYSVTTQALLDRRWTARSAASWTVNRQDSLGADGRVDSTLYSAEWQHRRTTQAGHWAVQVGVTRFDLGRTQKPVLTGAVDGRHGWSGGQTHWALARTVTSALLQFQLADLAPEQAQALAEAGLDTTAQLLRAPGVTLVDRLAIGHEVVTTCSICTWNLGLTAVHQQPQSEDPAQQQVDAHTGLGLALSARQQWRAGYRLSLQGEVSAGWPDDRIHVWDLGWSQQWAPVTRSQLTATVQRQSGEPERWRVGVTLSLVQQVF